MPSVKEKFQEAGQKIGMNISQVGLLFDEATGLILKGIESLETQEWPGLGILVSERKEEVKRKIAGRNATIPEKIEPKFRFDNKLKKALVVDSSASVSPTKSGNAENTGSKEKVPPPPPTDGEQKVWYFTTAGDSYGPMTARVLVKSPAFDLDKSQVFNETWSSRSWQRACDVAVIVKESEKFRDEKLPPIPMPN